MENKSEIDVKRENARNYKLIIMSIISSFFLIFIIFFLISAFRQRDIVSSEYETAKKLLKENKYNEAIEILVTLQDYKDGSYLLSEAQNEQKYIDALKLLDEKKYHQAISQFEQIANFKDSTEQIKEAKYNLGIQYFNTGEYKKAKKLFVDIGNYSDSAFYLAQIEIKTLEYSQDILYQKANLYFDEHNYEEALSLYEEIVDYKNSNKLILECQKQLKRKSYNNIMAAGNNNSITITNSGKIKTAGINGFNQLNVDSWENIVSIDIYGTFTIGLKEDKTAIITGQTYSGEEISDLDQWDDLIDVATGEQFVVGLKSNGDVIADGHNGDHQIDVNGWEGIIAIDAGSRFVVGLTEAKELIFAGFDNGQADKFDSLSKEQREEWKDVVNISASGGQKSGRGGGHTVGLKADGTLVAVGDNDYGQCDFSDTEKWSDIVKIATGDWYTVGLKSDGTVVITGENFSGCKYIDEDILNQYDNIVDIAAGYGQTMLLTDNGEIICFGFDDEGKDQLNGFKGAMIPKY